MVIFWLKVLRGLAKNLCSQINWLIVLAYLHRIQFTPDLPPADLTGYLLSSGPETGEFTFQSGPIFNSLIPGDEINRAPAKVQAAMLKRWRKASHCRPKNLRPARLVFRRMATQTRIEQEGTYHCLKLTRSLPPYPEVEHPDMESARSCDSNPR
ncbi:AAA family ATPase [Vibrio chagasii]|nr:AAA family ATPase [Vibrio chagasii]